MSLRPIMLISINQKSNSILCYKCVSEKSLVNISLRNGVKSRNVLVREVLIGNVIKFQDDWSRCRIMSNEYLLFRRSKYFFAA